MKKLVGIDQSFGGDGAHLKAELGVEGANLRALVAVDYPLEKVLNPIFVGVDKAVDALEGVIPGDQKAIAEQLKAKIREEALKYVSENPAALA